MEVNCGWDSEGPRRFIQLGCAMPMHGVPAVQHHRPEDWPRPCVETQQDILYPHPLPMPADDKQSWSVIFGKHLDYRRSASLEFHVILGASLILHTSGSAAYYGLDRARLVALESVLMLSYHGSLERCGEGV